MSTQLILYPQFHKGSYSSINNIGNQILVNGSYFKGLNSSNLYNTNAANPQYDAISSYPPTILGDWYRYTTTGSPWGAVAAPSVSTGNQMLLSYNATPGHTGIYQKLSGLSIGGIYDFTIEVSTPAVGLLTFNTYSQSAFSGNITLRSTYSISSNTSTITSTFTATSTNNIISIDYMSAAGYLLIDSLEITESSTSPTLIYSELEDGQVICDLYQEEDIPLTLSIDDFKSAAEKVQSYSKNFNLPATKRNNKIFDNMFEITRSDDKLIFNVYRRTKCVLKQDGLVLFEGYLRMIDVKDKDGQISYNVNLFSEVIALADLLADKVFSELNISELNHIYSFENVKKSWENPGAGDGLALLNPLSTSSFAYDAQTGVNNTQVLKYPFAIWNSALSGSYTNLAVNQLPDNFRPFIQLKYLLNKIFAGVGFTWTSNFFDSPEFENLFMDFNWGEEQPRDTTNTGSGQNTYSNPVWATAAGNQYDIGNNTYPAGQGFNTTTNNFTIPAGQVNTHFDVQSSISLIFVLDGTVSAKWIHTEATTGNQYDIHPITSPAVQGSALAFADLTFYSPLPGTGVFGGDGALITSIVVSDGGFYTSAPTVIIDPPLSTQSAYSSAVLTAVGPFPGPITSVTWVGGVYPYSNLLNPPRIMFDRGAGIYSSKWNYTANFTRVMQPGDTLELWVQGSADFTVKQDDRGDYSPAYPDITGNIVVTSTIPYITNQALLHSVRGELGQWEFLKGIMTMFNLVSLSDTGDPNNILIEPYADLFIGNTNGLPSQNVTLAARSIEHDWTDKVDVSQMELKPLSDLKKTTTFKFVDDEEDYRLATYKIINSGHSYGSLVWDASGLDVLQGEEEIIAEPFSATVLAPVRAGMADFIVPQIRGAGAAIENLPRIMYNAGVQGLSSCTYSVPASGASPGFPTENTYLQFGHLSSIPITANTQDYNFASNQLLSPLNQMPVKNLFTEYWLPYYAELYHSDTRMMTLKVNLTAADIAGFKLYDTVFIKNRSFRVNKIDYKPNSLAKVEFILIP